MRSEVSVLAGRNQPLDGGCSCEAKVRFRRIRKSEAAATTAVLNQVGFAVALAAPSLRMDGAAAASGFWCGSLVRWFNSWSL